MKCTSKEQDTCNVEKYGCEGCFYNQPNNIEQMLKELKKSKLYERSTNEDI